MARNGPDVGGWARVVDGLVVVVALAVVVEPEDDAAGEWLEHAAGTSANAKIAKTVSYTHLDVYKRQPFGSVDTTIQV